MPKPRKPRPQDLRYKRMLKKAFLEGVRGRLVSDVGPYFECVARSPGTPFGFWAALRMILPVIDATACTLFKRRKGEPDTRPERLLRGLGIECPELVWAMYRHSLIHGDELRLAQFGTHQASWEVRLGGGHHFGGGRIAIDAHMLYEDLIAFLDSEIQRSGPTHVWVGETIGFGRWIRPTAKAEFERLATHSRP